MTRAWSSWTSSSVSIRLHCRTSYLISFDAVFFPFIFFFSGHNQNSIKFRLEIPSSRPNFLRQTLSRNYCSRNFCRIGTQSPDLHIERFCECTKAGCRRHIFSLTCSFRPSDFAPRSEEAARKTIFK